jgi:HD-GYP domain-containing protein (c-di-GMP phosphodiesterase class II)
MRGTRTEGDAPRASREEPFDDDDERRWRRRPVLSRLLQGSVLLVPVAVAAGVAALVAVALPSGSGAGRVGWWMVVVGVALLVLVALDTQLRRLLPLAALLRLTLLFPDRAPSRFSVALRGTSRARLEAWAGQATRSGGAGDTGERAGQILSLAAALHAHDRMTRGHSERVRALTELVGEELRLTDDEAERLQWAALLHDIGKLSVPAEILNKPGKPDDSEWAVLQRHPAEGARIAAPLQAWLGEWGDAVVHHHERFDGTGYPEGLAGEHISLAGRIVSVTDAFETMTAVRSYKRSMSAAAARAELARCAGTHFDPRVVRAFLGVSLGRLHWPAGGALAWVAAAPPIGVLTRLGTRASAAVARPATATKTTAAIGVIVLGGLLAAGSSVTTGPAGPVAIRPSGATHTAEPATGGGGGLDALGAVRPVEPPAASPAPDAAAAAGSAPGAAAQLPASTSTGGSSAPTPAPGGGGGSPAPPAPAPVDPSPANGGAPPAPPAPSPAPPAPPASPGPSVGAEIGPISLTLLPAPSVQVGDLILP